MDSAIVIGPQGLLGRAVVAELERRGLQVFGCGRGSLVGSADYVFDCSGESRTYLHEQRPYEAFQGTVERAAQFASVLQARKKYVYASSSRVYRGRDGSGFCTSSSRTPGELLDDQLGNRQRDRYALNKLLAEAAVHTYQRRALCVRFCGLFGPRMKKGIVYDLLCGVPLRVTLDSRMQLLCTRDAAELAVEAALGPCVGAVNVASRDSVDVLELSWIMRVCVAAPPAPEAEYPSNHLVDVIAVDGAGKPPSVKETYDRYVQANDFALPVLRPNAPGLQPGAGPNAC